MKVRDYKKMWNSEHDNVFVFYSQYDMGAKYKVYRKVSYDGIIRAQFIESFETMGQAVGYAKRVLDEMVER